MHRAEAEHGGIRQRLHLGRMAHVAAHRQHLRALRFQFRLDPLQRILLDVGQHQLHAEPGADPGEFMAEAAGAAGDDRNLALKFFHVVS